MPAVGVDLESLTKKLATKRKAEKQSRISYKAPRGNKSGKEPKLF